MKTFDEQIMELQEERQQAEFWETKGDWRKPLWRTL